LIFAATAISEIILPIRKLIAGVVTAHPLTSAVGIAAGDAGHYRANDSASVVVMQGTAGEAADNQDLAFIEKTISGNRR
jgi:hypothetical protein